MRAEQRGAGLREQVRETWADTERTKTMTTGLTRFTQRSHTGEDSNWEPDGVTHQVRFCEGPGVTVGWLRSCGTAWKPGGNREDKYQPGKVRRDVVESLHFFFLRSELFPCQKS
jgi:hypothetical protein